jgi:RNA recognition motif-containing protein
MVAPSAAAPPPAAVVVVEEKEKQSVQIPDRPPYSMFVKNLSYDLDRASLKKYFVDAGLHVMEASISGDDKKPHRGYGQVEFRTRDSLEQALNMKNPQIMNRSVWFEVLQKRDVPRGRDESRHRQRSERKVEHGKGAKGKGEERRPPRREESRHVEAPKQEERSWRKPEETKKDDVSPRDQKKDDKRNRARSPRQCKQSIHCFCFSE